MINSMLFKENDLTDVMGPLVDFVTPVSQDESYCLIRSVVPAGVVVPLHSHADRETLFILAGELDVCLGGEWTKGHPGETIDLPPGVRHAFKNVSGNDVTLLLVTTMRMGRFFQEIGSPASATPAPPSQEQISNFLVASRRYGYWLGSEDDNAQVGINLAK